MSLSIMAFLLFLTVWCCLVLLLVYPQAFTLKAMDKQSFCKCTYNMNNLGIVHKRVYKSTCVGWPKGHRSQRMG